MNPSEQQPSNSYSPDTAPGPTQVHDFSKSNKRESWKSAASTILILVMAPLIALLLTAFVFQSYEVDGPSMKNTLQDKDRLIVWKVPRTISRITDNAFIPSRGDIVIFVKHGLESYDPTQDRQLIKRVIGLPGERVVVRGNDVTVYNKEHPNGFNPDIQGNYKIINTDREVNVDVVVPDGEIFVSGDNRPDSLDSRAFGTVPVKDVVGTLAYRIFPINKAEAF